MISDESSFQCVAKWNWRLCHPSDISPAYQSETSFFCHGLGFFSGIMGKTRLYVLPTNTTMNTHHYIKALEEHLIFFTCTSMTMHNATELKRWQNGLRNITSSSSGQETHQTSTRYKTWAEMKWQLENEDTSSVPCLIDTIKNLWILGTPLQTCTNLTDSIPDRIKMVIKAQGENTKYWIQVKSLSI